MVLLPNGGSRGSCDLHKSIYFSQILGGRYEEKYVCCCTGVVVALLIGACGKKAEQKAEQPIAGYDGIRHNSRLRSIAARLPPSGLRPIPAPIAESKPVAKQVGTKKKAEPQKPEKKVVTETETVPPPVVVMIPESTAIKVKLIDSIDSDVHVTGTKFRALLGRATDCRRQDGI